MPDCNDKNCGGPVLDGFCQWCGLDCTESERFTVKMSYATLENIRALVRETAYNASILFHSGRMGEGFSRAVCLYRDACRVLKAIDPDADKYIHATYEVPGILKEGHDEKTT